MTFNLRTNLEEVNEMILKIFEIVDNKNSRVGQARPGPRPGPARQTKARARSGFGLRPGLRPLITFIHIELFSALNERKFIRFRESKQSVDYHIN